jgi:CBS domain-containing protein
MRAKDVMSVKVVAISCKATVLEAAKLMLDRGFSGLPVVNDEGRLVGIVTESDLLRRTEIGTELHPEIRSPGSPICEFEWYCEYLKSHGGYVEDIMTPDVVRVFENTPLVEVAGLLELKRIKRVPVMANDKVIGIVSRADFLRTLVSAVASPAPQIPIR